MAAKKLEQTDLFRIGKNINCELHRTTIKNIVEGRKMFRGETIKSLCEILKIEPWMLFWKAGINNDGKPNDIDNGADKELCLWAVSLVINLFDDIELDDNEFKAQAISKVIAVASKLNKKAGNTELIKMIKEYSNTSQT